MHGFLRRLFLYETSRFDDVAFLSNLLQRGAMVVMVLLVVLTFTVANVQALVWQMSGQLVSTVLPALVVEQTNAVRTERFAPPLRRSHLLDEAAARKAEHMAANGYFAHYSPDNVSPWHWLDEVGYVYAFAGENLAVHFSDSAEVVDAWMQSPPQKANILSGQYTEVGVGTAKGFFQGHQTVFVVQLFGTPGQPLAAPLPRVDAPISSEVAPSSTIAIFSADSWAEAVWIEQNIATTTVLATVTDAPMVVAAESTTQVEDTVIISPEPPLPITDTEMRDRGLSMYSGMAATSSGLVPILGTTEIAGATKTALAARMATQPTLVISVTYAVLSIVAVGMLVLAVLLALRAHRPWQMVHSLFLLILMAGLMSLHFYLTSGALVS